MATASARMLELSPLPSGASARAHFLAIELGTGGGNTDPVVLCEGGAVALSSTLGFAALPDAVATKSRYTVGYRVAAPTAGFALIQ